MGRYKRPQKDYFVVQSNQLVRYIRHDMKRQQQRVYFFLASLITGDDLPDQVYHIKPNSLMEFLGMTADSGNNYKAIDNILKYLRDHSQWIRNERGNREIVSVLQSAEFNEETKEYDIQFHRLITPHLFNLVSSYTTARLEVLDVFTGVYSAELYEFLLSFFTENYSDHTEKTFTIKELKERLHAEKHERYPDFRRYVIENAINEINSYSDCMKVEYEPIKTGNKTDRIKFIMDPISDKEAYLNLQMRRIQTNYLMDHKKGKGRPKKMTVDKDQLEVDEEQVKKDRRKKDWDLPY